MLDADVSRLQAQVRAKAEENSSKSNSDHPTLLEKVDKATSDSLAESEKIKKGMVAIRLLMGQKEKDLTAIDREIRLKKLELGESQHTNGSPALDEPNQSCSYY
jgi:hypothetical protein